MPESEAMGDPAAWARLEWRGPGLRRPADRRVAVCALVGAIATDLAWHAGLATSASALLISTIGGGLLASGRLTNGHSRALTASVPVFAVWFCIRTSPWLLLPDLVAVAGIVAVAASLAERRSLFDLTVPGVAVRAVGFAWHAAAGLPFGASAIRKAVPVDLAVPAVRRRWREVVRGAIVTVPMVAVLATLLASADVVFASMFRLDLDVPAFLGHVIPGVAGFVLLAGILRAASADPATTPAGPAGRLGPVEVGMILGSVAALLGAFAAAQLVALSEGGRRVIETAGLTYAQYARSGFFQLVAVAVIVLVVVLGVRALADPKRARTGRVFVPLAEACIALTLVVVLVALMRMRLYEGTYGLTMLRLYVAIFSVWIGTVFMLTALWIAGLGRRRHWVPSLAVILGLVGLLALNALNPEALVVRRNVAHAEATGRFDRAYVVSLSNDAIPTLMASLDRLGAEDRAQILAALCGRGPSADPGWASWNRSRTAAAASLSVACSRSPAQAER